MFQRYTLRLALSTGLAFGLAGCGGGDQDVVEPGIRFSFPAEFTILSALETVRVIANDNDEITEVSYFADGVLVETIQTAPYILLDGKRPPVQMALL